MAETYFCMIESVGEVDENALALHKTYIITSSFLNIKNVHLQINNNVSNLNVFQLETIVLHKLLLGSLRVKSLYVRDFLLLMIIILWIWRTRKCCDASFANLSRHLRLI